MPQAAHLLTQRAAACEVSARAAAGAAQLVLSAVARSQGQGRGVNGSSVAPTASTLGGEAGRTAALTISNVLGARLSLRHSCSEAGGSGGAARRALTAQGADGGTLSASALLADSAPCSADGASRCLFGECDAGGQCRCHAYGCMEGRCSVRWFKRLAAPCAIAEDACEGGEDGEGAGMCQEYTCAPGVCVPGRDRDCRQGHCVPSPDGGPSKPSSLVRFLPDLQYLLQPASGVWLLGCGVLTSREA